MQNEEKYDGFPIRHWNSTQLLNYLLTSPPETFKNYRVRDLKIEYFEKFFSKFFRQNKKLSSGEKKRILRRIFLTPISGVRKIHNGDFFEREFPEKNFFILCVFSAFLALLYNPQKEILEFLPNYTGDNLEYLKIFQQFFFLEDLPFYYFKKVQNFPEIIDTLLSFSSYEDRESLFSFSKPKYLHFARKMILGNSLKSYDLDFLLPQIDRKIAEYPFSSPFYKMKKMKK